MPVADGNGVPLLAAFAAGLLSFLSPCVLPLIPSYVSFLTGMTVEEIQVRRGTALLHALWFVGGFSLIFIALGASASALGVALLVDGDAGDLAEHPFVRKVRPGGIGLESRNLRPGGLGRIRRGGCGRTRRITVSGIGGRGGHGGDNGDGHG